MQVISDRFAASGVVGTGWWSKEGALILGKISVQVYYTLIIRKIS